MNVSGHFKHINLTLSQHQVIARLESFFQGNFHLFMLKGYAGSGKTTLINGLVSYLDSIDRKYVLMAPTGRAANVLRERTGKEAFTIHKTIYSYDEMVEVNEGDSFYCNFKIREIKDREVIYIIDEASMIGDNNSQGEFFRFGTGHLLTDLITFSKSGQEGFNSKIIFVGDPCQLPPVGDNNSKAFDPDYLSTKFGIKYEEVELREVVRQSKSSGILSKATKIRQGITSSIFSVFDLRPNGLDVTCVTSGDLLAKWGSVSGKRIIIASKNKTCIEINRRVREFRYNETAPNIRSGDIMILGANNYKNGVFNGEFGVINVVSDSTTVRNISMRGIDKPVKLVWRDIEMVFQDSELTNQIVKCKMLDNFLHGDNQLTADEYRALYVDFIQRNPSLKRGTEEFKQAIMADDYFNCLLLKYGYAVTCHKAQGGEWDHVFTIWDHDITNGFNYASDAQRINDKTNANFYRWAYTAVTRASQKLYVLNPPYFNPYSNMSIVGTEALKSLSEIAGGQTNELTEVVLDEESLGQLKAFGLLDLPLEYQNHFLSVRNQVRKHYVEITDWKKLNFEIRYTFKREGSSVTYRTYVNGKNEFKKEMVLLTAQNQNKELVADMDEMLRHLPLVYVRTLNADTALSHCEFDFEVEEKYPFTKTLYQDLAYLLDGSGVTISEIDHLSYRERYTFIRNSHKAVIDFEYNLKGFWGRVVPNPSSTNSQQLLLFLIDKINQLKN